MWRINAWAELAALVGSVLTAVLVYAIPALGGLTFGARLLITTGIVTALWMTVMYLTPAESDETLERFYLRARPGGAWKKFREKTGLPARQPLRGAFQRTAGGVAMILGANLAIGGLLLSRLTLALLAVAVSVAGFLVLRAGRSGGDRFRGVTKVAPSLAQTRASIDAIAIVLILSLRHSRGRGSPCCGAVMRP